MAGESNPGCLFGLLKLLGIVPQGSARRAVEMFPYRLCDAFLSPAELSFYHVLRQVLRESVTICPKVRIADVLSVLNRRQNQGAANKIDRKHVDFLLCDPRTMRPLVAVELDDASHARSDRQERDGFVDGAFAAAGLPIVRLSARRTYQAAEIRAAISPYLQDLRPSTT